MYSSPAILLLFMILFHVVKADNPVKPSIQFGQIVVKTRKIAQLPKEGRKILCIVPHGGELYVCAPKAIYRVTTGGSVSLWFNVDSAIRSATDRGINISNGKGQAHGGVRSIAFHPSFKANRKIYISAIEDRPKNPSDFNYISDVSKPVAGDSVLLEFEVSTATGKPIPSSYRNVFRVGMPIYDHLIKQIAFYGKHLYIAHGDGSRQDAIAGGGRRNDALGKILRIDPLQASNGPYSIPSDNPFIGSRRMPDEVYAYGFRNPHHICFGRDGTLYAAETGRSNVEEVDLVKKGRDYGWPLREGTFVHNGGRLIVDIENLPSDDAKLGLEYPNAQVGHDGAPGKGFNGQAIAGGCPIENGSPLSGLYFYADFPRSGKLFYSSINELKSAVTRGSPTSLSQARTWQAKILYNDGSGSDRALNTLGDVVRLTNKVERVDIRFGRGPGGELYWSSKSNGAIYVMSNSLPSR